MPADHTWGTREEDELMPMPGDAVMLTRGMVGAPAGSIGIIEGVVGKFRTEYNITFNCKTPFRGKSSGDKNNSEMIVSCSGGPGTIATPASELVDTKHNVTQDFWRWKTTPQKDGSETYYKAIRLWEWGPAGEEKD